MASSRRIAQRLHEDIAFQVLAANNTPYFRTISDFRKDHLGPLSGLFHQVLQLCRQAGLVKLGHMALDSTKVRANASKHKAMSYGRMKERERSWKLRPGPRRSRPSPRAGTTREYPETRRSATSPFLARCNPADGCNWGSHAHQFGTLAGPPIAGFILMGR